MTTKAYQKTVEDVQGLGLHLAWLQEDLAKVMNDQRLSDGYKQQLAEGIRSQRTAQAKLDAKATWKRAQARAARTKQDLEAARAAVDDGINWQKLQVLSTEYSAKLKNPPPGRNRHQVLDDLVSQASASKEGRRALALAAGEMLSSSEFAQRATAARAALRQWQEEDAAPIQQAELEAQHAELGLDEIRAAILRTEEAVTGQRRQMWSISDWQRDVLSETPESLGQVVWHDDTSEYMKQAVPTPPAPSGIQE